MKYWIITLPGSHDYYQKTLKVKAGAAHTALFRVGHYIDERFEGRYSLQNLKIMRVFKSDFETMDGAVLE